MVGNTQRRLDATKFQRKVTLLQEGLRLVPEDVLYESASNAADFMGSIMREATTATGRAGKGRGNPRKSAGREDTGRLLKAVTHVDQPEVGSNKIVQRIGPKNGGPKNAQGIVYFPYQEEGTTTIKAMLALQKGKMKFAANIDNALGDALKKMARNVEAGRAYKRAARSERLFND